MHSLWMLRGSFSLQRELENCLEDVKKQWRQDRAGRALSSWRVTTGVATERAGAAAEMIRLRADLEKMRDERDEGWEAATRGNASGELFIIIHYHVQW